MSLIGRVAKRMHAEFERSVFWFAVGGASVVCAALFVAGNPPRQTVLASGTVVPEQSRIGPTPFAFLEPFEASGSSQPNPFEFRGLVPSDSSSPPPAARAESPPVRTRPVRVLPPAPPVPEPPGAEPAAAPAPVPVASPPTVPAAAPAAAAPDEGEAAAAVPCPAIRVLGYQGTLTSVTGQTMALLGIRDPDTGARWQAYVKAGSLEAGIRVLRFSDDAVVVRDAEGREVTIALGQRLAVVAE